MDRARLEEFAEKHGFEIREGSIFNGMDMYQLTREYDDVGVQVFDGVYEGVHKTVAWVKKMHVTFPTNEVIDNPMGISTDVTRDGDLETVLTQAESILATGHK